MRRSTGRLSPKILSNLMNNALKYSETMIRVGLSVVDDAFRSRSQRRRGRASGDAQAIFCPFSAMPGAGRIDRNGNRTGASRSWPNCTAGRWRWTPYTELNVFVLTFRSARRRRIPRDRLGRGFRA